MTVTIGSNIASLKTQRQLSKASDSLSAIYEKLSSGQRINKASDDAAGLAISENLKARTRVGTQAIRNLNDGMSALNVAEGALSQLGGILVRQQELSEQAANGVYSLRQRQALDKEAFALTNEFNRIVASTTFNGLTLLDNSFRNIGLQAGSGANAVLFADIGEQLATARGTGQFASAIALSFALKDGVGVDVNNDGKLDFLGNNQSYASIVALGNGDGTFQSQITLVTGPSFTSAAANDFNGDGNIDLVAAEQTGDVYVRLGNGNGTFRSATSYALAPVVSVFTHSVTTGDFNGDGFVDVASSNGAGALGVMGVMYGRGDGTFGGITTYNLGVQAVSIASGDVNGDGISDLAVNCSTGGVETQVFLGNRGGTLSVSSTNAFGGFPSYSLTLADFNFDGNADLITSLNNSTSALQLSNGNGTFGSIITYSGTGVFGGGSSDFNNDGLPDFISSGSTFFRIQYGDGLGTFNSSVSIASSAPGGQQNVVGDFNGDGVLDILREDGAFLQNTIMQTTQARLNLTTRGAALTSLETTKATSTRISNQLGSIGALQSRIQTAIANLSTQVVSETAAAARITDVDVASESSNLVRTQILQQAAASVLSQANLEPEIALRLLGG